MNLYSPYDYQFHVPHQNEKKYNQMTLDCIFAKERETSCNETVIKRCVNIHLFSVLYIYIYIYNIYIYIYIRFFVESKLLTKKFIVKYDDKKKILIFSEKNIITKLIHWILFF